jgi:hypothetical protein
MEQPFTRILQRILEQAEIYQLDNGIRRFNYVVVRPQRLDFRSVGRLIKGRNLIHGEERQFVIDTLSRPKRLKVGPNFNNIVWVHFIPHIYSGLQTPPQTINGIQFLPKQIVGSLFKVQREGIPATRWHEFRFHGFKFELG